MEFRCRDLPEAGILLVPPSSPDYQELLADIEYRLNHPVEGSMPRIDSPSLDELSLAASAILLNRSGKSVVAWSLIWDCEDFNGHTYPTTYVCGVGGYPSLLLPFGLSDQHRKLFEYWHVILPGSKRRIVGGSMIGDNTDVRLPTRDEMWKGGGFGFSGSRSQLFADRLKSVTFSLDGIFFTDGEFVGPNRGQLWEHIFHAAEAYQQIIRTVKHAVDDHSESHIVFQEIESLTGPLPDVPPPPPPPNTKVGPEVFRQDALYSIARRLSHMKQLLGDEKTVQTILSWADAQVPQFHRRDN